MLAFEETLGANEWRSAYGSMKGILSNYYDNYYGDNKPKPRNFLTQYLVSDMPKPTGGYGKGNLILELSYAEKETRNMFDLDYAQNVSRDTVFTAFDHKQFQDAKSVFQKIIGENKYVLVVSVQQIYFEI